MRFSDGVSVCSYPQQGFGYRAALCLMLDSKQASPFEDDDVTTGLE